METLVVLSVQRLLCVTCPSYLKHLSFRRVCRLVLGIWLVVLGISVPPLTGWGRYVPETSGLRQEKKK